MDAGGLNFEIILEDIETLNQWAFEERLDITKLSFPAFFQNVNKYVLLNSGAALGKGVGPILISKKNMDLSTPDSYRGNIQQSTIALPGKNTTANLLFSFAYPEAVHKFYMRFDKIEDAVITGQTDLGVIIHENRFTYEQKGLYKVLDLGAYWETKMSLPIPLGGIVIKKTVDKLISLKANKLIRKSLEYAFAGYPAVSEYVKQHAQTMSEEVMRKHIDLYVNDFSLDLGTEGKLAIEKMYTLFLTLHPTHRSSPSSSQIFLS